MYTYTHLKASLRGVLCSVHSLEQGRLGSVHTCALVTWIKILFQTPDGAKHISKTHMEPGSGLQALHATVPSPF